MPLKRRRSPAEKKALSYAKDRRNSYGENDKAARKAIPRNKAKGHRSNRRRAAAQLSRYEALEDDAAALAEGAILTDLDRLKRWQKCPDQTLGNHIAEQGRRRAYRSGRKVWSKKCSAKAKEIGLDGYGRGWRGSAETSMFDTWDGTKFIKVKLD